MLGRRVEGKLMVAAAGVAAVATAAVSPVSTGTACAQLDTRQAPNGGCFLAGTLVLMSDGSARPIEELVPGDSTAGGTVRATVQVHCHAAAPVYSYRGVTVTGNHAVLDSTSGRFLPVSSAAGFALVPLSDLPFGGSVAGTPYSDVVFDLITSEHRIFVYVKQTSVRGTDAAEETDTTTVVEFADYTSEDAQSGSGRHLMQLNDEAQSRPTPGIVARVATGAVDVHVRSSRPPLQVPILAGTTTLVLWLVCLQLRLSTAPDDHFVCAQVGQPAGLSATS